MTRAEHRVLASVTRITDFAAEPFEELELPRSRWRTGDYVLAVVTEDGAVPAPIEEPGGRVLEVLPGDVLVGVLGRRRATLEVVGDWQAVRDDLAMSTLTAAGVLGRCTSASLPTPQMASLSYRAHAARDGRALGMADFAVPAGKARLKAPVVMIIGTSMSSGKTVAAKAIVRALKRMGMRVAAAKLTGVGRYRDILAARDAGADLIADFVDAGLPSTAVPRAEFEPALDRLLALLAAGDPDVVVVEAGASPLEPYNGDVAVRRLEELVACTVLCASDPYAVVGVIEAFGSRPDLVTGRATSTEAGVALVGRLTGLRSLNLIDHRSHPDLEVLLQDRLEVAAGRGLRSRQDEPGDGSARTAG